MFWFGKRKNKEDSNKQDVIETAKAESDENEDIDELAELDEIEDADEENFDDIEKIYGSEDDDAESDEEDEEDEEDEDEADYADLPDVSKVITSLDMLAEFVTTKSIGEIQFFNKQTCEAFELREGHLRIAEIWGSVSMAREYSPLEFAKIMQAIEVIKENNKFLVLPSLTESEAKQAIIDFCEQKYGENGKKYASNVKKFAKLVNENGDMEDWRSFNKELVYDKLVDFCDEHEITFERSEAISENE